MSNERDTQGSTSPFPEWLAVGKRVAILDHPTGARHERIGQESTVLRHTRTQVVLSCGTRIRITDLRESDKDRVMVKRSEWTWITVVPADSDRAKLAVLRGRRLEERQAVDRAHDTWKREQTRTSARLVIDAMREWINANDHVLVSQTKSDRTEGN